MQDMFTKKDDFFRVISNQVFRDKYVEGHPVLLEGENRLL